MESEINLNSKENLSRDIEFISLKEDNQEARKDSAISGRARNKLKSIKEQKNKYKKKFEISQAELSEKQQQKLKIDIRNIFKSSQFINHNLKSLQKELKINDTIVAIISTIIILLSFIQVFNLIDFFYDINDKILTLRTCIMILSIPNIIFIYRRYKINLEIRKINLQLKEATLVTSGLIKMFFVELIINIIQPFPYLETIIEINNGNNTIKISLSHLSLLFNVMRIYLTIKLIDHYNRWTNTRSKRIGNLLGFKPGSFFVIRVMLKNSPLKIITILSVFFIATLAMLIRAFEYFDVILGNQNFSWFWNALWLNIITMTTIGYGDIVPITEFGKIFCVISCIFGIFLLSMLVAVITLMITLDDDELNAYKKICEKDILHEKLGREVKDVFNLIGEIYKKKKDNIIEKSSTEYKHFKLLLHFRLLKLNEKTKLLGLADFSMEKLLSKIEAEIENHMADILSESLKILKFEKRFYEIMNKQVTLENRCLESKNSANKISNLATFITEMESCGNIENIDCIEGGRLFSASDISYEKRIRTDYLKNYLFLNH